MIAICPVIPIASDDITERCAEILTWPERDRADSLSPGKRRDFIQTRASLRVLIARRIGCTPREVAITGERGRPLVLNHADGLQVSVSRTSGAILVGLAKGCRLGIDVENLRDVPEEEIDALAARWFCEYDAARIAAHPRGDRARAFLELWTRAEAYSKALGVGLALDFAEAGPFLRAGAAMPAQSLRIEPLDLDAEFVGAVAYAGAGRRIAVDRWTSVEVLLERDAAAMAT